MTHLSAYYSSFGKASPCSCWCNNIGSLPRISRHNVARDAYKSRFRWNRKFRNSQIVFAGRRLFERIILIQAMEKDSPAVSAKEWCPWPRGGTPPHFWMYFGRMYSRRNLSPAEHSQSALLSDPSIERKCSPSFSFSDPRTLFQPMAVGSYYFRRQFWNPLPIPYWPDLSIWLQCLLMSFSSANHRLAVSCLFKKLRLNCES